MFMCDVFGMYIVYVKVIVDREFVVYVIIIYYGVKCGGFFRLIVLLLVVFQIVL